MGGVVKSVGGLASGVGLGSLAQGAGGLLNVGSPVGATMQAVGGLSAGVGTMIGGAIKANGGLGAVAGKAAGAAQGVFQGGMGALGDPSGMKGGLGGIGKVIEQLGPGKLVDPKIGALVGQAGDLGPAMHKVLVGSVLKQDAGAAYCALLLAAVKKVNEKKNFNLEVEINDLLVKLGNLRDPHLPAVGPSPSSKAVSAKVSEAMDALGKMVESSAV